MRVLRPSLATASFGLGIWVIANGTHISSIGLFGNERGTLFGNNPAIWDLIGYLVGASIVFGIFFFIAVILFYVVQNLKRFFTND